LTSILALRQYLASPGKRSVRQFGSDVFLTRLSQGLWCAMPSPSTVAQWVGFLLFGGFFGVIFWKLASGAIPLDRLLENSAGPSQGADGSTSASRTQCLAITLFVALYYLVHVIQNPKEFPDIPGTLVAVLAGSQALYLGGKSLDLLPDSWRNIFR
jgi:hypothetical protein